MFLASPAASWPQAPVAVGAPLVFLGVRFMLLTLDSEIRECYRHAAECIRSADQSRDWLTKQDFLDMEERWLCLARNYEFAEQLSNFSKPCGNRQRQNPQKQSFGGPYPVGEL
jgi:hypothetical protein